MSKIEHSGYLGRLAPTPSGRLHMGHAYTFAIAYHRARQRSGGQILLRIEDLDLSRCKPIYVDGIFEDLEWLGLQWDRISDQPKGEIYQSRRLPHYCALLKEWARAGWIYPSAVSRKQIQTHPQCRQSGEGEIIFPESLRTPAVDLSNSAALEDGFFNQNWRWRVNYGSRIGFTDLRLGEQAFVAGEDFGDFLVWSKEGRPSYEMAVVVDDIDQKITEVVRGEDLRVSTARQLLIYDAMKKNPPDFFHCPLVKDERGVRLAKSFDSMSIETYRNHGATPADFLAGLSTHGFPEVANWYHSSI